MNPIMRWGRVLASRQDLFLIALLLTIIFMISFDPAQILCTRASRHARATRYSFM